LRRRWVAPLAGWLIGASTVGACLAGADAVKWLSAAIGGWVRRTEEWRFVVQYGERTVNLSGSPTKCPHPVIITVQSGNRFGTGVR
jgi:hypothetical protein